MVGGEKKADLVVRNAATTYSSSKVDVAVKDGVVIKVGAVKEKGGLEYDANGRLVLPGFINIHTHLDKAALLSKMRPDEFGLSLEQNRELLKSFKKNYRTDEIKARARGVLVQMAQNGCTAVRTQVDVDTTCGLKAVEALIELKAEVSKWMTLELCVFPQQGLVGDEAYGLCDKALSLGCDLMGGLPLVEKNWDDRRRHVDAVFELAKKHGVKVDAQLDESNDPREFILPYFAEKTIEAGYEGKVTATHCISLAAVDDKIAQETIRLMKHAGISVNVTPSANLLTLHVVENGLYVRPHNSITRVIELIDAGIPVSLGTDNIRDVFYPLGNCSIIRELHVLASAVRMTQSDDPTRLLHMASEEGAKSLGLNYGIKAGCAADFIILDAHNPRDVINGVPYVPAVFKGGKLISETEFVEKVKP
ncbi:5'-deoxyadenosine deaminase [uncultured archaeon]|nr:5'-deoxyadenosine deaminase [uncultured archaeon]